jgi:hypothetical protein
MTNAAWKDVALPPASPARHSDSDHRINCNRTAPRDLSANLIGPDYPHMESLFHNDFFTGIYEAGIFDDGKGFNNILNVGFDE